MRLAGVKNFKLFEELNDNVLEIPPGDRMAPKDGCRREGETRLARRYRNFLRAPELTPAPAVLGPSPRRRLPERGRLRYIKKYSIPFLPVRRKQ